MKHKLFYLFASLTLVSVMMFTQINVAFASSFTVDSTTDAVDANPGDGICASVTDECTLRAAIQEANALPGDDTITLPAGSYVLTIAGENEDASATGDIDITSNLIINGIDAANTIIDGNGSVVNDRVFQVTGNVTVDFSQVTITGGNGNFSLATGDGIFNAGGTVTLTNSAISGNTGPGASGILNVGTMTIMNSVVSSNSTTSDGGGIHNRGSLELINSTVSDNVAGGGLGGGIFNENTLMLSNSTVNNNTAAGVGGGIWNFGDITLTDTTVSGNTADFGGGGIINGGTVTATNSTISGNTAIDGGGINNQSSGTFILIASTVNNNVASNTGGGITNNGTMDLTNSTISGNASNGEGGGIRNVGVSLTLNSSTVSGNTASSFGGGIFNNGGTATLTDSTINNNTATNGSGGGIENRDYSTLVVTNSTISSNTAGGAGGISNLCNANATLTNSTVSGNTTTIWDGGGITNCGWLALNATTITKNTANDNGGGISNFGILTMGNVIIAGNVDTANKAPDCAGAAINSLGYNLIQDTTGCTITGDSTGNLTEVDPILGPLQDNGGSTFTHALLSGSPAINAGNPAGCTDQGGNLLITDQRGVARVGICDIGAYEVPTAGLLVTSGNHQSAATNFAFPQPLQVTVFDNQGSPTSGVTVTFTAPASGPSGTFADTGTNTTLVDADANGVATTSIFTANDQAGAYIVSVSATGLGSVNFNLEQFTRPANDDFDNAISIDTLPFSETRDTSTATSSFDDPTSCHSSGSVWYQFTPSSDMTITANTIGSDYDTTIGVFTGLPGDLSLVPGGCNDDYYGLQSHVSFTATSGTTYYFLLGICCGSGGNGGGNLILSIEGIPAPPNNNFANAEAVNSLPFSATTDVTGASNEPDEPQWCYSMPNTVWYSFTPTETMSIRADTQGGAISGNVNIYRAGTGIYDLQFLGCAGPGSSTQFLAEFGETYYLQAGAAYGEVGNIQVNLQQFFPPANDNFTSPTAITSLPFTATPDITNAGVEPNEPQNCYYMPNTVWYSFTPTENTLVRTNTQGSSINSNLNVYKPYGPEIYNLNYLGCTVYNGPITFLAEAGQTYYIQAGGIYGEVGTIQVNLEQLPLPANDDFANATLVSSPLPFENTIDTQYSTRQTGEPTPSCAYYGPGSRSVWYAFTPTTSGSFSAGIPSAMFTPVLAVYTGSSLTNLSQIGCQPYGSLLTFHANAGTTYYFQVSNLYPWDQGGSMQFHLDVTPPPQASFYTNPWDPSKYDTVQFQDSSYDPGNVGFQTYTWNFGDGTTANGYSATHKYAADGDYQVTHSVTTTDGRTASITQTVQVRTHDVAITRIAVPNSANAGQTKTITVTLRNIAYPETVQIDLYKSTPNGFVWVATVTRSVPALSGNRTTAVNFSYTFTSDDVMLGKVTFKAVATLVGARDAYPSDNEAISLITKVAR